jgi:hypothetical protein
MWREERMREIRMPTRFDSVDLSAGKLMSARRVRAAAEVLAQEIDEHVGCPRYAALAHTSLEQAVMWAVKGVARGGREG